MFELLIRLVNYYIQVIAIMNPFAALPAFISLTDELNPKVRRYIINRALITMIILIILFTLLGGYILYVFNLSINALRVGGGLLLTYIGLDMLSGLPRTKRIEASDIAVVPIATPLIVGPGTITTILLLTSLDHSPLNTLLVLVASILAALTTYLLLRYSDKVIKLVRPSVIRGIARFMSLIIVSVAVEMIVSGLESYIEEFLEKHKGI